MRKKKNIAPDRNEQHFLTRCPHETEQNGAQFAHSLEPGDVVLLCGDLGSGKTVFTRGIVNGLCPDREIYVSSPSFMILLEYPCPVPVYHVDLFRLEYDDILDVGLDDYINDDSIVIIEWAEKLPNLPPDFWWVELQWVDETTRSITLQKKTPAHFTRS